MRPDSAGTPARLACSACSNARRPAQPRGRAVRRQEPHRQLPRHSHLRRIRQPRRHLFGDPVGNPGVVEVAQVPQQRHVTHRRDDGLPGRRIQRTLQPAGQRLPGHPGRRQPVGLVEHRPAIADRKRRQLGPRRHHRQFGGDRVAPVVPPIDRVPEQRTLPLASGLGVGQCQDVTETHRPFRPSPTSAVTARCRAGRPHRPPRA